MRKWYFLALLLTAFTVICEAKGPRRAFSVIQMTDPQFGFIDYKGTFSLAPEKALMDKAVKIIGERKPAFVVCTGDFVHLTQNDSATKVYEDYIGQIRRAGTKVYMVPGNHDLPKVDEEHMAFYRQHFGADRWAFKYKGCAFIGLNSSIMQIGSPEQEAEHFAWLEGQLRKMRKCRYKFVFMHISFFTNNMDEAEEYFNQPKPIREKYMRLLDAYGVNAVFCGHLHRNAYGRYKDVEVVTSNAVGMDLTGEDRHGMTLIEVAPSGYSHKYMTLEEFQAQRTEKHN